MWGAPRIHPSTRGGKRLNENASQKSNCWLFYIAVCMPMISWCEGLRDTEDRKRIFQQLATKFRTVMAQNLHCCAVLEGLVWGKHFVNVATGCEIQWDDFHEFDEAEVIGIHEYQTVYFFLFWQLAQYIYCERLELFMCGEQPHRWLLTDEIDAIAGTAGQRSDIRRDIGSLHWSVISPTEVWKQSSASAITSSFWAIGGIHQTRLQCFEDYSLFKLRDGWITTLQRLIHLTKRRTTLCCLS